ncbi:MAG TPA: radical SAM protein [Candidatus Nitrosotenuis sp.]|jgi:radical SAM superfamily enzyme YgiQ (UPF0313 family)|nr:radical SAM protein [Candidatus Nitrosotenuis sp.]
MSWKLIHRAERRLARETSLLRPAAGGDVRLALGYPNTYHVGMSNLGMQVVYGLLNRLPGVVCERFFLPDPEEIEEYELCGRRLFTLESQSPVGSFDIVAFTVSYEQDYPNLARLLEMAGVPLFAADRGPGDPLVLVGGAITFLNPEPLADMVDVFCVGEGEGLVEPLVEALREGAGRPELLERLAHVPGYYVPSLYVPRYEGQRYLGLEPPPLVRKAYLSAQDFARTDTHSVVLTDDTEFGRSGLLEISRGCPYICRFCTVGYSYPKVRWKPVDRIWAAVEELLPHTRRLGLISATAGNHPEIGELCRRFMEQRVSVSWSSLRADRLPDEMIQALVAGGSHSLTLAPETGSEDLRRSINKRFSDAQFLEAAERAFRLGVRNLKMYSMVGLPHERDSDMDALVDLVRRTREVQVRCGQGQGHLTLTLGEFVPKPLTPYQWTPMCPLEVAGRRMQRVEQALRGTGGVRVRAESPRYALVEALLARGDRRLARVIARVRRRPSFGAWMKALQEEGLDLAPLVFWERSPDQPLPWGHISASWTPERLLKESRRAERRDEVAAAS